MKAYLVLLPTIGLAVLFSACSSPNRAGEPQVETPPKAVTSLSTDMPAAGPPTQAAQTPMPQVFLGDEGPAPVIANDIWINSDGPLTLESQRGKVVLLEFWTFGCINCRRVIPYIQKWHAAFTGDDFQVLSIHYPEFPYERDYDNVVEAIDRLDVAYPVALDNDGRTWRAYRQRYWPTTYLIDKNGHIRYKHIGEFSARSAAEAEAAISALLAKAVTN